MSTTDHGRFCWYDLMSRAVDAPTEKATGLGATVLCPPTDIPHAGRFSVIMDPQGAVMSLFTDA